MRELTERAARNCEEAREPVCKCRCGGRLHGSKRGGDATTAAFLESLPADDPHHVTSAATKARLKREAQERKWRLLSQPPVTWEDMVR